MISYFIPSLKHSNSIGILVFKLNQWIYLNYTMILLKYINPMNFILTSINLSFAQSVKSQPIMSTMPFSSQSGESTHSPFLGDAPPLIGDTVVVVRGFFLAGHTAGLTRQNVLE